MFVGSSVADWLNGNIVVILFAIIGLSVLVAAINKKPRDAAITFGIAMLGLLVIAAGANHAAIGQWLRDTFFGG